jgi:hypothetical protein
MDQLKPVVARYLNVVNQLDTTNARATQLRDERRTIELDLAAVYHQNNNALPDKIELKNSHMVFQMKKPGEWKKGWNLTKKQLEIYLDEILPEHGKDVFNEIVRKHEGKLVGQDYQFDLKQMSSEE